MSLAPRELRHRLNRRKEVLTRDRGICRFCGFDAPKCERIVARVVAEALALVSGDPRDWDMEEFAKIRAHYLCLITAWGCGPINPDYDPGDFGVRSLWAMDHIVPVVAGGTNEMVNLRTLCRPCHRRVTTGALTRWCVKRPWLGPVRRRQRYVLPPKRQMRKANLRRLS